jgi:hypothetical protein
MMGVVAIIKKESKRGTVLRQKKENVLDFSMTEI